MKIIKKLTSLTVMVALMAVCGLLIASNPRSQDYEEFAINELSTYLKENACDQLNNELTSLQSPCQSLLKILIDTSQAELKEMITQQTEQQNFILFTVYRTTLNLPSPLPSYEVETLGILQHFFIYHAGEI
jgi:hypothetical protein